jgi:hypothetical protein
MMEREVKSYSEFINEMEKKIVYPTNFKGMVQGAVSNIHSQVLAIAQELANEKAARNPYRYDAKSNTAGVDEVDITRALNLIFHSDWKKLLKEGRIQEWAGSCIDRAGKHDDRADKKNQRALRSNSKQKDNYKVDLGNQGFSRESGSSGRGNNS